MIEILSENETSSDEDTENPRGYQLRAFKGGPSSSRTSLTIPARTLPNYYSNANVSSLSSELMNETLNYFVNCRQRLDQMTKTYDDTDAYILLLQEKECDLELAARIGQDLLRQNKQLRESIQGLEEQLSKRHEDIQQLRHELALKNSLLDTFIEEEENLTKQNLMQQEKIFQLQEKLNETDRRLSDLSAKNATLQKSTVDSDEAKKKLYGELKTCKRNFGELLRVFIEEENLMQQEKISQLQEKLNETDRRLCDISAQNATLQKSIIDSDEARNKLYGELKNSQSSDNEEFSSFLSVSTTTFVTSPEPNYSMDSACISHRSESTTPSSDNNDLRETDSEHSVCPSDTRLCGKVEKGWLRFSSYILTSIFILCLSVTITSTANLNLAQKLQLKLDK